MHNFEHKNVPRTFTENSKSNLFILVCKVGVKLIAIASTTGGTYTPVTDPSTLPNVFPSLSLTNIVGVTVNGNQATLYPNGNFEYCGLPLSVSANVIVAQATSTDQTTGRDSVTVERLSGERCKDPTNDVPEFTTLGALAALTVAGLVIYMKRR